MFRFDELKITLVIGEGNNLIYNNHHLSYNALITKRFYFCKKRWRGILGNKKPRIAGLSIREGD
jgi:hypothetical protein